MRGASDNQDGKEGMKEATTEFDDRSAEGHSQGHTSGRLECPECGGQVVHDEEHGETTCDGCGLVTDEAALDRGPEWRTFGSEERTEKSRVGAPTTQLMHDKGLSTVMGWRDRDTHGQRLPARKRLRVRRMRRWDERFRTKNARERNLKQALAEIARMSSALGLPEPIRETAGVLYRRAVDEDLLPGRSIEGMATACLYAAARRHDTPRSLSDIATVSRVEELRVQRAYRYLARQLELGIPPADPAQYVQQFASRLDATHETERNAHELLDLATSQTAHSGKSPAGLAAGAIYAATRLTGEHLTQATVSEGTHVSQVTIRDRYQELLEIYVEQRERSES